MTWPRILTHWKAITADLHQWYGVDAGDRQLMRARSWPWLQDLIVGLLSQVQPPSRLAALLNPPPARHH